MTNTNFPNSLDNLSANNPTSTQLESAPVTHHLQHGIENDAIQALQLKVGINTSTDHTSLDYLVKSAANPGHSHTGQVSFNSAAITGTNITSGMGFWSDGTILYIVTNNTSGSIYLRPNGPSSTVHQLRIGHDGTIATTNTSSLGYNKLDDGAGNMVLGGGLTLNGPLVGGIASIYPYSSTETSASSVTDIVDVNADGHSTNLARADHKHGREGWSTALPLAPTSPASPGTSSHPAHADHSHPSEQDTAGIVKMWAGSSASPPSGYLTCDGHAYPISSYTALYSALTAGSTIPNPYNRGTVASGFFMVPDFRGVGPMGVGTANPTYSPGSTAANTTGAYTGSAAVAVPLPSHDHGFTVGSASISSSALKHSHGLGTGDGTATGDQHVYGFGGGAGDGYFTGGTGTPTHMRWAVNGAEGGPASGATLSAEVALLRYQERVIADALSTAPTVSVTGGTVGFRGVSSPTVATVTPSLSINFIIKT